MATFSDLPSEVHQLVLQHLNRRDRVSLGFTNKYFNRLVNKELYKIIAIGGSTPNSIPVEKLALFATRLSNSNFNFIKAIYIHAQSNLVTYDYSILYEKLYRHWDSSPGKVISLINYDSKNVRQHKLMTHYVYERSFYFLQEEDPSLQNLKINNLTNWLVLDFEEALSLPYNNNLRSLKLFVEPGFNTSNIQKRSNAFIRNLQNLQELYLSTPNATTKFNNYFAQDSLKLQLKSLSLTISHSHMDGSRFYASQFDRLFDKDCLEKLELKINCVHQGCQCMSEFFRDVGVIPNLRSFVLVNCNSNNSQQNLLQLNNLMEDPNFYNCIKTVDTLHINLSDCTNNRGFFRFDVFTRYIKTLANLSTLVMPDFFKTWSPHFFERLNICSCSTCQEARVEFKEMAIFDDANHYKHEFDRLQITHSEQNSHIESNKINLNFYNFLVSQLKKQFVIKIYSTNAVINFQDTFVVNEKLRKFSVLFAHCMPRMTLPTNTNLGGAILTKQVTLPLKRSINQLNN